jgi:hypothetical protein
MKSLIKMLAAVGLAATGMFGFTSCAVLVIGAAVGTAVYLEGDLESQLATDIYGAVNATNEASQDLQLTPVSRTGDANEALLIATDTEGRKVSVKLRPSGAKVTKINIRVGSGGNEGASRRILSQIEKRVKN